ncbi:MAG: hypothetical protein QXX17_03855 [Conexivisphaerales archaeon]
MPQTTTEAIAGGAVFGALASAISYMHISLPFAPLPYLEFQFAEIAIVMAVILYGPVAGTLASFEYLIILEMLGQFAPFGPLLAFLGVGSVVLGMVITRLLVSAIVKRTAVWNYATLSILMASVIRVPLLTVANLAYFYLVAPNFISIASTQLSNFFGIATLNSFTFVLLFTAVFNIIQNLLSIIPATAASSYVFARWNFTGIQKYWLPSFTMVEKGKVERDSP